MPTKRQPTPEPTDPLEDYTPVQLAHREDGWTAERQRTFLSTLAETGCVSHACADAGVTARSAYRLRLHPKGRAFSTGWDQALVASTQRLTTLAFERATRGGFREVWKDGELVSETRQPSDKLLMFLLQHLATHLFGKKSESIFVWAPDPKHAPAQLAARLPTLEDVDLRADPLSDADFTPQPPDGERA